jgi:ABC-type transporter Mla subunit MlaD
MTTQKEQKTTEIKAGIFIIASLALFLFGVFWLRYFTLIPEMQWTILFKKPGILNSGYKVYYQGMEVGKISDIKLSKDYKYTMVKADIYEKNFTLPVNSTASVIAEGIAGQKYIILNIAKKPAADKLKDGSVIMGNDVYTLTDLQDSIKELVNSGKIQDFIKKTDHLMNLQVTMTENFNTFMNENRNDIRLFSKNAASSSILLRKTLSDINEVSSDPKIKSDLKQIVFNGKSFSSELSKITRDENIKESINNVAAASKNLRDVSVSSQKAIDSVNNSLGGIGSYTNKITGSSSGTNLFTNLNDTVLSSQETLNSIKCLTEGVSDMLSKKFLLFKFAFGQPGKALNSCQSPSSSKVQGRNP